MYFGHFAIGVALKACQPKVSVWPIMIGVGLIDILNGIFIIAGLDIVTPDLKALPYLYFDLTYIDWDHSLLMAIIWSSLFGLLFWRKSRRTAIVAFIAAISHFIVDIPLHNSDMAIFPTSQIKIGMGLWGSHPYNSWVLEILFSIILLGYGYVKSRKEGINILPQLVFITLVIIQMSPWLSPMKIVAKLGNPYDYLLHGVLVSVGFIAPSLILILLYKRSYSRVKAIN